MQQNTHALFHSTVSHYVSDVHLVREGVWKMYNDLDFYTDVCVYVLCVYV